MCHCVDGFVRNKCGDCVKPSDCNQDCKKKTTYCRGPNENPVGCDKRSTVRGCTSSDSRDTKCKKSVCDCIEGYLRNKNGLCVKEKDCSLDIPRQCTNPCTKKNEIYRCLNGCLERKCSTIGISFKCSDECTGGCDCIEGYRRDDNGECIPEAACSTKNNGTTTPNP